MSKKFTIQSVTNKTVSINTVLERMTDNPAKAWTLTNQPSNTLLVPVTWDFNVRNYADDSNKPKVRIITNLIAVGGTVKLAQGNSVVTIRLNDKESIDHYRVEQMAYCFMGKYDYDTETYEYPEGKPMKTFKYFFEDNMYYALLKEKFKSTKKAVTFFNSAAWKAEVKSYGYKSNLKDLLVNALCVFQEEYLINDKRRTHAINIKHANLKQAKSKLGIDSHLLNGEIPNQEVTPFQTPSIHVQRKFQPGIAPYVSTAGDYIVEGNAEYEAKLVNAWFYQHEEFRVPSYDEQLQELEELEEWLAVVKTLARRTGQRVFNDGVLLKFDRLEELRFLLSKPSGYSEELGADESEMNDDELIYEWNEEVVSELMEEELEDEEALDAELDI